MNSVRAALPFALIAFAGAVSACGAGRPAAQPAPEYPGDLATLTDDGRDFMARQRVEFARGETRVTSDVVIQKVGDELTVIALSPMGTRAYVIRQKGAAITSVDAAQGAPAPVPPEFVLLDIHRTYFLALTPPATGSGTAEGVLHGERVTEAWADGVLAERRFLRAGPTTPGAIHIRFAPKEEAEPEFWLPGAVLENPWLGYRLTIRTVSATRIPPRTSTRDVP